MERKYLPSIVGLGSNPRANVGKVLSEGFDGNFAFREKINKVDITVRGNITYSQNTILEKDEEIMCILIRWNEITVLIKQKG